MNKIITLTLIAAAVIVAAACTGKTTNEEKQAKKALVLYYSKTGTTQKVAEEIKKLTGADVEAVEVEAPYTEDYPGTIARVQKEREDGVLPTLKPLKANVADYDIIYIGYPIWFGTYAPPIAALVKAQDFAGKKVVPFCTFGSGGLEMSAADLKAALPQAEILPGYGVREARIDAMPAELDRFMKESGLVEGEVEALPEFSEGQPVDDAQRAVFDIACGDYPYPLGTPLTFATRTVNGATEYKFGTDSNSTVYILAREDGGKTTAEFTKVVR